MKQKVDELDKVYSYVSDTGLVPGNRQLHDLDILGSSSGSSGLRDEDAYDRIEQAESTTESTHEGEPEESQSPVGLTEEEKCVKALANCHAVIHGLDGVGAMLAQRLVLLGVSRLTLVDPGSVEVEDLRGLFYLPSHLGMARTECVAYVFKRLHEDVRIDRLSELELVAELDLSANEYTVVVSTLDLGQDVQKEVMDSDRTILANPKVIMESCFEGEFAPWSKRMELIPKQSCCVGATLAFVLASLNKLENTTEDQLDASLAKAPTSP